MLFTNAAQVSAPQNMFIVYLLLVGFSVSQEINPDTNDLGAIKPDISIELEDLGDYNEGPNYPWISYRTKLSRSHKHKDKDVSSSSSEEMSNKQVRRSDSEAYLEENLEIADDYDDNILEEPTVRMGSPLELLGHFLSGKEKVLKGLNDGVLGGKVVLDGIHEITKGHGEFLVTK